MESKEKSKKLLRNKIKMIVQSLSQEYCDEADKKILTKVVDLPEFKQAKTVFCYIGSTGEIQTASFIQYMLNIGKKVVVPKCISKGIMEAYRIESLEVLKSGAYGILEPCIEGVEPISPVEIDLVIVPCLSADIQGRRLGYGGGFYDRYLLRTKAYRVLLCREKLICDEIPVEEHDEKMDIVITEIRRGCCEIDK